MSLHEKEIKAWSYRERTARIPHQCRICGGHIAVGTKYLQIVLSDEVTPSSEKLRNVAEHLDCNMPWYTPADRSPTTALARIRVPINIEHKKPKVRYETISQSGAGTTTLHAPDRLQLGLELLSETARQMAITEIANMHAILANRLMDALGSKRKMQQLGNDILRLQAGLGREPDLSRSNNDADPK